MSKVLVEDDDIIKKWFKNKKNLGFLYIKSGRISDNIPNSDSSVTYISFGSRCVKIHDIISRLDCFDNLYKLYFGGCKLDHFPEEILEIKALKELTFSEIKIDIPDSISSLKNLRYLSISYNDCEKIPNTLGELKSLTMLDCSNNKIKELPSSICMLNKLKTLKCSENQLESLPDAIGMMDSLRVLRCKFNKINTLPLSFKDLKSIKEVDFTHNLFTDIPMLLFEMDLKKALFTHNKIKIKFSC